MATESRKKGNLSSLDVGAPKWGPWAAEKMQRPPHERLVIKVCLGRPDIARANTSGIRKTERAVNRLNVGR